MAFAQNAASMGTSAVCTRHVCGRTGGSVSNSLSLAVADKKGRVGCSWGWLLPLGRPIKNAAIASTIMLQVASTRKQRMFCMIEISSASGCNWVHGSLLLLQSPYGIQ